MENIADCLSPVNTNSLFSFFFERYGSRSYFSKNEDGTIGLVRPSVCASGKTKGIPNELYYYQDCFQRKRGGQSCNRALWWAKRILCSRDLNEEELRLAVGQIANYIPLIQAVGSNGNVCWFEGNAKGTARYNTKQRGKILDFVQAHSQGDYDACFLTLTCDIKQYANRADAWENYIHSEFYPVTENLRKHYGAEYVATMESTAKGYPHIHIILFFPKGRFAGLSKLKNKQKIRYGRLYNMIKSTVKSPVFCLEKAEGKGLKWYLTKYISKGEEENIFDILKDDKPLTKSQVKACKEFVYLKLFNRRKVLMTRKGCKKKAVPERLGAQASVPSSQASEKKSLPAAELRAALTSICTNSPLLTHKSVYSMSFVSFAHIFDRVPERNNDVSEQEEENFCRNGRLMYDSRSFISDFMKFVLSPLDSPLNLKFYKDEESGCFWQLTDGFNLDDDGSFLDMCAFVFDLFCTKILLEGYAYKDILDGTAGLSNVSRKSGYCNGKRYATWSVDPANMYYTQDEMLRIRSLAGVPPEALERRRQKIMDTLFNKK